MWRIIKSDNKYCVHQEAADGSAGEMVAGGTHSKCKDATDHMRALYANTPEGSKSPDTTLWVNTYADTYDQTGDDSMSQMAANGAVRKGRMIGVYKSADDETFTEGWAMLFTDPEHKDLDETYFTAKTETLLEYYENAPLFYEHGADPAYGGMPIGKRVETRVFPRGVYLKHKLHRDHPQFERTVSELKAGLHTHSTDSMSHYVAPYMSGDGSYGMWPASGCAITRRPAEPALGEVSIKAFYSALAADAEARESQSNANGATSTDNESKRSPKGMQAMSSILVKLAEAFGVEAEKVAVKGAINAFMSQIDGDDEAEATPDVVASLSLEEGATVGAAKSVLEGFINQIDQPAITIKTDVLASAKADLEAAAKGYKPTRTVGATVTDAGANKSTTYTTINQQRAEKPTLAGLVLGVSEGKSKSAMKALGYSIGANGRWMVNTEVSQKVIELFYAKSVIRALGATYVPMEGIESVSFRKLKSGAAAFWRGEGQSATPQDASFGVVTLNLKELVAPLRINRRLLRNGIPQLESMLTNDIAMQLALKQDISYLTGTGAKTSGNSGAEPLGVLNVSGVTSTSLGTNGKILSPKDCVDAYGRIADQNVPSSDSWGMVSAPRTLRTIRNTTDTTGQLIPADRFTQGYKALDTTQIGITDTVGSSTDCTKAYFGAWEYLIVGMGQEVTFTVDESIYVLTGEVYIEGALMTDAGISHPEAFQVLTGVRA